MKVRFLERDESYPPYEMKPGGFVDFDNLDAIELRRLRSRVSFHGAMHGKRFSVRRTHPIEHNYRCWRLE